MKFSEVPVRVKNWAAAISAVAVIAIALHNYFQTDAEAAEHVKEFRDYQAAQLLADRRAEINRARREIKRIEFQLYNDNLSPEQRNFLELTKKEYEALILCLQKGHDICS